MITDVFAKRYSTPFLWSGSGMPAEIGTLLRQLAHVVMFGLLPQLGQREKFCESIHNQLARELGIFALEDGASFEKRCGVYLARAYNLWNDAHGSPDCFLKTRLSLVELIFREADVRIADLERADQDMGGILNWTRRRDLRMAIDCLSEAPLPMQ